jgi:hypothetical protein
LNFLATTPKFVAGARKSQRITSEYETHNSFAASRLQTPTISAHPSGWKDQIAAVRVKIGAAWWGNMIIDFHTHVLSDADKAIFSKSKFHSHVLAKSSFGRSPPHTIENVLHAAKVGGVIFPS